MAVAAPGGGSAYAATSAAHHHGGDRAVRSGSPCDASCIERLLSEDPYIVEALAQGDASFSGPAMLELIACLTPAEAEALTPPGEGPAPDPTDIACLMNELEGTPSGERIIAVLSGADTTAEGLTTDESAALGGAVEACDIETEFGFPDQ